MDRTWDGGCGGLGGVRLGRQCFTEAEFQLENVRRVWRWMAGRLHSRESELDASGRLVERQALCQVCFSTTTKTSSNRTGANPGMLMSTASEEAKGQKPNGSGQAMLNSTGSERLPRGDEATRRPQKVAERWGGV